jgi:hypothetical protein
MTVEMPSIVAMAHVESGAVVLTSEGNLHFIALQKDLLNNRLEAKLTSTIDLHDSFESFTNVKMAYNHATSTLFIIGNKQMMVKQLNNATDSYSLHSHKIEISEVKLIRSSNWYLYILTDDSLYIYYYDIGQLRMIYKLVQKIEDMRIDIWHDGEEVLYLLDRQQGVQMLTVMFVPGSPKTIQVKTSGWWIGEAGGRYFDFQGNSLMMVVEHNGLYSVVSL